MARATQSLGFDQLAQEAFAILSRHLPWVAEEGQDRESVKEESLEKVISEALHGPVHAATFVAVLREQLLALALLDPEAISRGEWRFVSFPALLCARSLLRGLATSGFQILERGFWEPSEYLVDKQRSLLRHLEHQRIAASEKPDPIRRVWVSWVLLACDGNFLLVRREDSREHREGSRGAFALPGGKLSPVDLDHVPLSTQRKYFDADAKVTEIGDSTAPLSRALRRELHEEVGLSATVISSLSPAHPLFKYVDLEGAASAHALTEYFIQIFRLSVTQPGREQLWRAIAEHPQRYSWFSATELVEGRNFRGEAAYVHALHKQFGEALQRELANLVSEMSGDEPLIDRPFSLPDDPGEPLRIGVTGNERAISLGVDHGDLAVVAFLAAARRGDPVKDRAPGVKIAVGPGWLVVDDDAHYRRLVDLAARINQAVGGVSIVAIQGRAIRINVADPKFVFFSPEYFSVEATDLNRGKNYRIRVIRRAIETPLGVAESVAQEAQVSEILGGAIYELLKGNPGFALDNIESVKRMQRTELASVTRAVGARLLVRQVEGVPELAVSRAQRTPNRK